jgi:5'-nucleotidase
VTDTGTYRVAANNFLVGAGDGFSVFTQGTDLWSGRHPMIGMDEG